jgi:hypothetical protein
MFKAFRDICVWKEKDLRLQIQWWKMGMRGNHKYSTSNNGFCICVLGMQSYIE